MPVMPTGHYTTVETDRPTTKRRLSGPPTRATGPDRHTRRGLELRDQRPDLGLSPVRQRPLIVAITTFWLVNDPFACPIAQRPNFPHSNPLVRVGADRREIQDKDRPDLSCPDKRMMATGGLISGPLSGGWPWVVAPGKAIHRPVTSAATPPRSRRPN